jgi:hypothetical protein
LTNHCYLTFPWLICQREGVENAVISSALSNFCKTRNVSFGFKMTTTYVVPGRLSLQRPE